MRTSTISRLFRFLLIDLFEDKFAGNSLGFPGEAIYSLRAIVKSLLPLPINIENPTK